VKNLVIEAFGEATAACAAERFGTPVRRGRPVRGSTSRAVTGMAALVGLTGELQGKLMLDFDQRAVAGMFGASDDVRHDVAGLAEEVTARALKSLRGAGVRIASTPPMVFSGHNLEMTNSRMETVAVPIEIPGGMLVVSIAARGAGSGGD
jgi:chemotaxis protein CheX